MKISIITPSFNRVEMIETAIKSVLDQNYPEVEHIIVDGGSTDGTLDVLKKFSHLRVISGPDKGMYDAINKGLNLVTGEIVGFLNSDDCYAESAFYTAKNILTKYPEIDVVWGSADMREMTPTGDKTNKFLYSPKESSEFISKLILEVPIFNACFFRRHVFEQWGLFLSHLKISGDREFMLRMALGGAKFHTSHEILYHYFAHENSMTYSINPVIFEDWNTEHCQFAEFYLAQENILKEAKDAYRYLHSISNLSLMKLARKSGNYNNAFGIAVHGWRINPNWPIVFVQRSLRILLNWLHGVQPKQGLYD